MTTKNTVKNYDFIDTMRFIAMIGIVMEHSSPFLGLKLNTLHEQIIQTVSLQFIKFGTIVFFILAGFLIGDKFNQYTTKQYLGRRLNTTFKPWIFWVTIFMVLFYIDQGVRYLKHSDALGFTHPLEYIFDRIHFIIVQTSFWFIINFMLCITILLVFRKYMYNLMFGAILGLLSLFYSVNLYYDWIPTGHTTALLGFVFYLWLGVILHKYFDQYNEWITKQPFWLLFGATLITFIISCAETINLIHLGSNDSGNTLRFSNIIFSLVSFLVLYKYCNFEAIEKLKPRSMTFGIHLLHHILIIIFLPMILRPLKIVYANESVWNLFFLQFAIFILIYASTYTIVYYIGRSKKWKWTVGQ
ncbi:Acyltransferase family protein [Pedobacter terrae]|uniref:Acyltransferase family protein n=1 Tax=Pedobacter terrae TaxID=405671 RepID=A0A1G8BI35_9SPHI|nr:acyltransferase [Pedobacter terrae]SDH32734.1 Acyltransferase family protein [Pedobacter terrae]